MRMLMVLLVLLPSAVLAHGDADWIRQGGFKSRAGVFCCGVSDCIRLSKESVSVTAGGYRVNHNGRVAIEPFGQTLPSDDDDFWICWPPESTPRCFFAPPAGV